MAGKELFFLTLLEIKQHFFHQLSGQPKGFNELHQGAKLKEKRNFFCFISFLISSEETRIFFFPAILAEGKDSVQIFETSSSPLQANNKKKG